MHRPSPRSRVLPPVVAVALAVAGCGAAKDPADAPVPAVRAAPTALTAYAAGGRGASGAEAAGPRAAAATFERALVDRDPRAACAAIAPSASRTTSACVDGFRNGMVSAQAPAAATATALGRGDVTVRGDRAIVRAGGSVVPVRRTAAGWRVDDEALVAASR